MEIWIILLGLSAFAIMCLGLAAFQRRTANARRKECDEFLRSLSRPKEPPTKRSKVFAVINS